MSVRPDWTVILTDDGFEALPLVKASLRLKPLRKEHAIRLAEKLNADEITADVAERFGPGEVVS
jgi:hypothetical protein